MPKFAANLTMMFTELPFLSRFAAAAEAGFDAVEFLFPYEFDKGELASLLAANGLTLVLHNLPAGDWAARRARHCMPSRPDRGISRGRRTGDRLRRLRSAVRRSTALQASCPPASMPMRRAPR